MALSGNPYLDFLATAGIDYAHPGGKLLTEAILRDSGMKSGDRVLDIGCGTGATAALIAEKIAADVTAVDIHPEMIARASERAATAAVPFTVCQGSAEKLPFAAGRFDWVLSESVTAFTDPCRSVSEYMRVLRPGRRLIAIEMTVERKPGKAEGRDIQAFYGVDDLYTEQDWLHIFTKAGFVHLNVTSTSAYSVKADGGDFALPAFQAVPGRQTFDVLLGHIQIMQAYKNMLSYRIYGGEKPV